MQLLLTEREVGEQLRLGRSTVRRLMDTGQLAPIRIGRSLRFAATDVQAYIARLREEAQDGQGR